MREIYRAVLVIHVALGSVALVAFWAAIFARKGSHSHKRRGRVFVVSMAAAAATALLLCLAVNVFDVYAIRPPDESLSPEKLAEYPDFVRNLFNGIAGGGVFTLVSLALAMSALRRGDVGAHVGWILAAGTAGHTAFLVSVLPKLLPGIYSRDPTENPIPWLIPPLVGGIASAVTARRAARRYGPRLERRIARLAAAAGE